MPRQSDTRGPTGRPLVRYCRLPLALVLEGDGDLWQKDSPVYVRGKPIGEWEER